MALYLFYSVIRRTAKRPTCGKLLLSRCSRSRALRSIHVPLQVDERLLRIRVGRDGHLLVLCATLAFGIELYRNYSICARCNRFFRPGGNRTSAAAFGRVDDERLSARVFETILVRNFVARVDGSEVKLRFRKLDRRGRAVGTVAVCCAIGSWLFARASELG